MKDLAAHDRPREKLERSGVDALGDNELLAVVIGHGTSRLGALEVANRLLARAGGVHGLTRMHPRQISTAPGVGAAVAARVVAAIELGRRTLMHEAAPRPQFLSPQDVAAFLLPQFGAYPVERFGVVLLDARHRVIRVQLLSSGTRETSVVHPRDVFREAALATASGIVLFHNHPSGDVTPSEDDVKLTRRFVDAGRLMGIPLLDHVILADNRFASMKRIGRF